MSLPPPDEPEYCVWSADCQDRTPDEVEHCVWSLCMVGGLPVDRIEEITDLRLGAGMASHWQAQDHNWAAAQGGRPAARRGRVRRLAPRTARPRWWRLGAGGRAGESFSGLEHDDPVSAGCSAAFSRRTSH